MPDSPSARPASISAPVGGLVAVHAHPDDESITMGATLARCAASGVPVTLVTATLGEQGETMYGALDGLTADRADQLGGFRLAELRRACRALGVADQRLLGGVGCFRDSGMAGTASAAHPRAFARAQVGGSLHVEAVTALAAVLRETRPRVVVTYDATGGYGHPDHIAAHQVAVAAFGRYLAECREHDGEAGQVAPAGAGVDAGCRLLEVVRPRTMLAGAIDALWAGPVPARYTRPGVEDLGTTVADDAYDLALPVGPWAAARRVAMAAHVTQLDVWAGAVDGFALTNLRAQPLLPHEYFRLVAGASLPRGAASLFAGIGPRHTGVR